MKPFVLILLISFFSHANAAELFGVNLANASRDELRIAVKNSGVKLVQEAGIDAFYDIYKGGAVLHKAKHLYLGFVKKDKKFAFAEYEFIGLQQPGMLRKLNKKYGPAQRSKGKFMSDQSYSWLSNGIKITFYQDWPAHKMRLTYVNPEALKQLKRERQQFNINSSVKNATYLEHAY